MTGAGAVTGDGRLGAQAPPPTKGRAMPAAAPFGGVRSEAPAQASAPRRTMKPQVGHTRSAPMFVPHDGQILESAMTPSTVDSGDR